MMAQFQNNEGIFGIFKKMVKVHNILVHQCSVNTNFGLQLKIKNKGKSVNDSKHRMSIKKNDLLLCFRFLHSALADDFDGILPLGRNVNSD